MQNADHAKNRQRGSVLIMVLAILVVMALMAAAFLSSVSLHKDAAKNYFRIEMAREASLSGRGHAIAVLKQLTSTTPRTTSEAWVSTFCPTFPGAYDANKEIQLEDLALPICGKDEANKFLLATVYGRKPNHRARWYDVAAYRKDWEPWYTGDPSSEKWFVQRYAVCILDLSGCFPINAHEDMIQNNRNAVPDWGIRLGRMLFHDGEFSGASVSGDLQADEGNYWPAHRIAAVYNRCVSCHSSHDPHVMGMLMASGSTALSIASPYIDGPAFQHGIAGYDADTPADWTGSDAGLPRVAQYSWEQINANFAFAFQKTVRYENATSYIPDNHKDSPNLEGQLAEGEWGMSKQFDEKKLNDGYLLRLTPFHGLNGENIGLVVNFNTASSKILKQMVWYATEALKSTGDGEDERDNVAGAITDAVFPGATATTIDTNDPAFWTTIKTALETVVDNNDSVATMSALDDLCKEQIAIQMGSITTNDEQGIKDLLTALKATDAVLAAAKERTINLVMGSLLGSANSPPVNYDDDAANDVAVDNNLSWTGRWYIGGSKFFRVIVRGQLVDVKRTTGGEPTVIADSALEFVYCPDADLNHTNKNDSYVAYQRWIQLE